jgi:hypothetical protein
VFVCLFVCLLVRLFACCSGFDCVCVCVCIGRRHAPLVGALVVFVCLFVCLLVCDGTCHAAAPLSAAPLCARGFGMRRETCLCWSPSRTAASRGGMRPSETGGRARARAVRSSAAGVWRPSLESSSESPQ